MAKTKSDLPFYMSMSTNKGPLYHRIVVGTLLPTMHTATDTKLELERYANDLNRW